MLKQCEKCGVFFGASDDNQVICESCKISEATGKGKGVSLEDLKYEAAKDIVRLNTDISPERLIKEMDEAGFKLNLREIMDYVKQGKMTLKSIKSGVFCEECGKKILSGRLCPTCTKKLEEKIKRPSRDEEVKDQQDNDQFNKKKNNNRMYSRK